MGPKTKSAQPSGESSAKSAANGAPSTSDAKAAANGEKPAISDEEIKVESAKAARSSLELKKQAKELREAAYGAGDPEERQKLLEKAIDKEIAAESFGKTAKYLRSGTFQGMAVGTGLGIAPGATLGALTGTLVGGLVSTITGTLGAGIGAAVGALHGPFWNLGEVAGKGIRKVTGDGPGWKATDAQKKQLEKMIGQANEEDMPEMGELEHMVVEGGDIGGWWETAAKWMPASMGGQPDEATKRGRDERAEIGLRHKTKREQEGAAPKKDEEVDVRSRLAASGTVHSRPRRNEPRAARSQNAGDKKQSTDGDQKHGTGTEGGGQEQARKKPRKLQVRSDQANGKPKAAPQTEKKKPKKLEVRGK